MVFGYFDRKRKNRAIVDELFGHLTQAARSPAYYAHMNVPDTVMGRFEMLSMIMVLFFRRTDGADGAVKPLAQDVVDTFFENIDHSLRELGVGDVSVPKRMKKLARMFYGRATAYGDALGKGDRLMLADALSRNIFPPAGKAPKDDVPASNPDMSMLAQVVIDLDRAMKDVTEADLLSGQLPALTAAVGRLPGSGSDGAIDPDSKHEERPAGH